MATPWAHGSRTVYDEGQRIIMVVGFHGFEPIIVEARPPSN
jgi:hypothetical protein